MPDLELILQRLVEHKVRFVLVGGYAAIVHGATSFTQDTDVCCAFTPANLKRLLDAVRDREVLLQLRAIREKARVVRQK